MLSAAGPIRLFFADNLPGHRWVEVFGLAAVAPTQMRRIDVVGDVAEVLTRGEAAARLRESTEG